MDQLIFKGVMLTEQCEQPTNNRQSMEPCHDRWCYACYGTGQIPTAAGEAVIELVRTFGRLAEKDHSHSIS